MDTVLVTGFGPFGQHSINASWEAVKLLPTMPIEGVNLVIKEIPVGYIDVDMTIPNLWREIQPKLVVHVGVSAYTRNIKIETQANRTGYTREDCHSKLHPTTNVCCASEAEDCIKTLLDINQICKKINCDRGRVVEPSNDAGRYLCEYIYYTSLKMDRTKTLFVHVPILNEPFSAKEIAEILRNIIICALECSQTCESVSK